MKNWLGKCLRQAAWAPLAVFVFYVVAAKGFDAYIRYPWLDMPTHFVGGAAITYFFLVGIAQSEAQLGPIPRPVQLALSLGLTAITAVVWEFLEFASDVALGTKMNLGVSDTLSDLFFGLLGGVVVIACYRKTTRLTS